MSTYTCNKCGSTHAADNVAPVCVKCYEKIKKENERLRELLKLHGYSDNTITASLRDGQQKGMK